jgi:CTP:molybdopterin cytidylyltransferase MocA
MSPNARDPRATSRTMASVMPAIVLAAGASRRMGRPKALLPARGRTFLGLILDTLTAAGLADIIVVVRGGDDAVVREIERARGPRAAVNPYPEAGQLSSLLTGLDAADAPGVTGVLVTLVDVPLIQPSTVRTLMARAEASRAAVLRAAHRGRHGHPVVFKRETFESLRAADPAVGAKAVVRAAAVEDVEVDDPAVAADIDTPEDYERLLTGGPPNP